MTRQLFPLWILAAGEGSRVGQSKGLKHIEQKAWLLYILERYAELGGQSVWIVLGAGAEQYFKEIDWLPQPQHIATFNDMSIHVVINPNWKAGQFSSIQLLSQECVDEGPVWIFPVDGLLPTGPTLEELQKYHQTHSVVIPTCKGKGGHPVLVSHQFWKHFIQVDPQADNARLDRQIQELSPEDVKFQAVEDRRVLVNLNKEEDWNNIDTLL